MYRWNLLGEKGILQVLYGAWSGLFETVLLQDWFLIRPELLQEPEVVSLEQADVIDLPFQHSHPFQPHAECKIQSTYRIYATGLEYGRIHHTGIHLSQPNLYACKYYILLVNR